MFSVPSVAEEFLVLGEGGLIYSQSQEVQKKCSKSVNFLQFLLKTCIRHLSDVRVAESQCFCFSQLTHKANEVDLVSEGETACPCKQLSGVRHRRNPASTHLLLPSSSKTMIPKALHKYIRIYLYTYISVQKPPNLIIPFPISQNKRS